MERQKIKSTTYIVYILYLIYIVGIVGHIIPALRDLMLLLTPFTLFLTFILVVFTSVRTDNTKIVYWLISLFIMTFILEVVGAKTGIIFGEYSYGSVLGFKILDVPIIIGFNWSLIIFGCAVIVSRINVKPLASAIIAGTLAVLLDLFIEPIAIKLGYWNWTNETIPVQNYLAWFIITVAAVFIYSKLNIKNVGTLPVHFFIVQLVFFVSLNIFIG